MSNERLDDFYEQRQGNYVKPAEEEDFFLEMNRTLQQREQQMYRDYAIDHPFIFVFGAPRSGTTLITQLLSTALDCGYMNNLMARFWLAPLHGIRLSRAVMGGDNFSSFHSDHARTSDLRDIHEFGYFWRDLLKKEHLSDITQVREREKDIDWLYVRRVLGSIQHEFGKPLVFKNIFGSYHLQKLKELLGKVIYVYIERDPLDSAISILEARRKYYSDLNTWWSYTPVEYDEIKDLDYREQIAGQVFFLHRYYRAGVSEHAECSVRISYEQMAHNPLSIVEAVQQKAAGLGYHLAIAQPPPVEFPFRSYTDRPEERAMFQRLLDNFAEKYR